MPQRYQLRLSVGGVDPYQAALTLVPCDSGEEDSGAGCLQTIAGEWRNDSWWLPDGSNDMHVTPLTPRLQAGAETPCNTCIVPGPPRLHPDGMPCQHVYLEGTFGGVVTDDNPEPHTDLVYQDGLFPATLIASGLNFRLRNVLVQPIRSRCPPVTGPEEERFTAVTQSWVALIESALAGMSRAVLRYDDEEPLAQRWRWHSYSETAAETFSCGDTTITAGGGISLSLTFRPCESRGSFLASKYGWLEFTIEAAFAADFATPSLTRLICSGSFYAFLSGDHQIDALDQIPLTAATDPCAPAMPPEDYPLLGPDVSITWSPRGKLEPAR